MDELTINTDDYVLAHNTKAKGKAYAVYLPEGGSTNLTLEVTTGTQDYWQVQWYDPRRGGALSEAMPINNNTLTAPDSQDWVALITLNEG